MNPLFEVVKFVRNGGSSTKMLHSSQRVKVVVVWFWIFLFSILMDHSLNSVKMNWERAIEKYRALATTDNVGYIPRTATASLNIGTDGYFDNETILCQFERLFQLIEFKGDYKNHQIEILVDNARTHTAKSYSLQDFGKNIGTRCPVEQIEYVDDHGSRKMLDCYFKDGPNKGKSKGLVELWGIWVWHYHRKLNYMKFMRHLPNIQRFRMSLCHIL